MEIDEEFRDKLRYVWPNNIENANKNVKNSLLRVLMAFMLFESEFFESPIYEQENKNIKRKYVSERLTGIQDFFNNGNYKIEEYTWFTNFQNYFYNTYFLNEVGRQRFDSIAFKEDSNLEGLKNKTMKQLRHFLTCAPCNEILYKKYFEENKKLAIKNALQLCYVFRNNICHGKKGLDDLTEGTYTKDFNTISDFLIELMKFMKEHGAKKF